MTGDAVVEGAAPRYRLLALLLCCGHYLLFFDRFLLAVAAPLVLRELKFSDSIMGLLLGPAFALTYGVAAIIFGRMADSGRLGLLLMAGLFVWAAGTIGTGFAGSLVTLALARAVLGIGQAAFVPSALTMLVNEVPLHRRGAALSWFISGSTLGRSSAVLAGGALLGWFALHAGFFGGAAPWRLLFVLSALPNLLLLLILPWVLGRGASVQPRAVDRQGSSTWLRRHPVTIGGFAVTAVAPVLAAQSVALWLPTMMVREHGLSAAAAGVQIGAVTLITAPAGGIAAGWAMDRFRGWREAPARIIVTALAAALLCMLGVVSASSTMFALVATGAFNLVLGLATFAGLFGMQELTPIALRGSTNGYFLAFATLVGTGVGPSVAGLLSDLGNGKTSLGIAMALLITMGLCVLVAGAATLLMRGRFAMVASAATAGASGG